MRLIITILALFIGSGAYFGANDLLTKTVDEMKIEQEEYFKIHGDYLPRNENELKKGTNIQTYDGTQGKGYIIVEETALMTTITDLGKEGRSQIIMHEASTTPL